MCLRCEGQRPGWRSASCYRNSKKVEWGCNSSRFYSPVRLGLYLKPILFLGSAGVVPQADSILAGCTCPGSAGVIPQADYILAGCTCLKNIQCATLISFLFPTTNIAARCALLGYTTLNGEWQVIRLRALLLVSTKKHKPPGRFPGAKCY